MKGGDRKSKTEAELKASGTFRADRHANRLKAPTTKEYPPPELFDKEHLEKWNEVCGHLSDFDILAEQDFDSIKTYVEAVILQRKALKDVAENGMSIEEETKAGPITKISPAWRIYMDCEKVIKPLREQFGFTPRARQSIQVKPKKETKADPMAAILGLNKKAI